MNNHTHTSRTSRLVSNNDTGCALNLPFSGPTCQHGALLAPREALNAVPSLFILLYFFGRSTDPFVPFLGYGRTVYVRNRCGPITAGNDRTILRNITRFTYQTVGSCVPPATVAGSLLSNAYLDYHTFRAPRS